MHLIATGSFPEPEKLKPLLPEEVKKVHELHDQGIILASYKKVDEPGVILILDIASLAVAKETLEKLPLAKAGLITFEYAEVEPF